MIGNGICNEDANNEECGFDNGDCCFETCKLCSDGAASNGGCQSEKSKCKGITEPGSK